MLGHVNDNRMRGLRIHFSAVSIGPVENIPGELDDAALEAKTDSEVRFASSPAPPSSLHLTLGPSHSEPARHYDSVNLTQRLPCLVILDWVHSLALLLKVSGGDQHQVQLVVGGQ